MGPHCLPFRLLKHFHSQKKQTTFVAIGALRVKHEAYCVIQYIKNLNLILALHTQFFECLSPWRAASPRKHIKLS